MYVSLPSTHSSLPVFGRTAASRAINRSVASIIALLLVNPMQNPILTRLLPLKITTFNNKTYATSHTAPEFSVTWQYPQRTQPQPVHAFPNIQPKSGALPVVLQNLQSIKLGVDWTYGLGREPALSTNVTALAECVRQRQRRCRHVPRRRQDKRTRHHGSQLRSHGVVCEFRPGTKPLGFDQGAVASMTLEGTTLFVVVHRETRISSRSNVLL